MKYFDALVEKIKQNKITKEEFFDELKEIKSLEDIDVEDIENLKLLGLPLSIENEQLILQTAITKIKDQKFCIVDIEANGS
ncbi:MAG: DNA polymerase III subunit epsilon, partial [Campylobacteraceae bacterium]|nr:DNA polymerase III subunit epsilon [Campylobacteraceae bacterium]